MAEQYKADGHAIMKTGQGRRRPAQPPSNPLLPSAAPRNKRSVCAHLHHGRAHADAVPQGGRQRLEHLVVAAHHHAVRAPKAARVFVLVPAGGGDLRGNRQASRPMGQAARAHKQPWGRRLGDQRQRHAAPHASRGSKRQDRGAGARTETRPTSSSLALQPYSRFAQCQFSRRRWSGPMGSAAAASPSSSSPPSAPPSLPLAPAAAAAAVWLSCAAAASSASCCPAGGPLGAAAAATGTAGGGGGSAASGACFCGEGEASTEARKSSTSCCSPRGAGGSRGEPSSRSALRSRPSVNSTDAGAGAGSASSARALSTSGSGATATTGTASGTATGAAAPSGVAAGTAGSTGASDPATSPPDVTAALAAAASAAATRSLMARLSSSP